MNVAKPLKLYTVEEFEQMEKGEQLTYELIDGVVMMSPRPALKHQLVAANLHDAISPIVKNLGCYALPEIELALDNDYIVPDMSIICEDAADFVNAVHYKKAPLIVMEIVSPSSSGRDYMLKRLKYQQLGIAEYWIVSPEEKCIWVIHYASQDEHHYCDGEAKSAVLPELTINLEQIFV